MNKITIPALLLGVVMVAGAFAFMPVQEASTVHTSATNLGNMDNTVLLSETMLAGAAAGTNAIATWTINQPYCILAVSITTTVDTNTDLDLGVVTVNTDMMDIGDQTLTVLGAETIGDNTPMIGTINDELDRICGATGDLVVDITAIDTGFDANDAVRLDIIVQAQSDIGTVSAVITNT